MEIRGVKPSLPRSRQMLRVYQCENGALHWCWHVSRQIPTLGGGGLHCPLILQDMFLQAAHSGTREAEQMIHWDCQHGLLCLDPQAEVSTIWSVGSQTSREEIQDLYYQAYKLRRLPESLLCGLEWADALARDIVSSLKNCLRQKEDELPEVAQVTHLMQSRTPQGDRGGTSAEIQLANVREAHWNTLATTITLEEKIEWLSWSITR